MFVLIRWLKNKYQPGETYLCVTVREQDGDGACEDGRGMGIDLVCEVREHGPRDAWMLVGDLKH